MTEERLFDLKRAITYRLRGTQLMSECLACKTVKRRVGIFIVAMKRAVQDVPIGNYNGELWRFGGKCYIKMAESEFGALINDCMEAMNLPYEDMMFSDKVARVCRNEVMKKHLYPQTNIVVFDNCVFDVDKNAEYDFNPKYVQVSKLNYAHNFNDRAYEWMNFLDYVLPDKDRQNVLQEYLGSIFIDRQKAKMEKILILLGTGANGKSVVFDTVIGVLGRDNVTHFGLAALMGGTERKHTLASCNGKRLNYCSEIRAIEIGQDSDALKTIISGEPIEARMLNGQYFMARDLPLLMANANKMPKITDMTHGMKRRLCVVRFNVTVPKSKQNPLLSDELEVEYPGIFNWMMEGRERFIKNGYKLSYVPDVVQVLNEFAMKDSTVLCFMHTKGYFPGAQYTNEPCVWKKSSTVYKEYIKYCNSENIIPESLSAFGKTLNARGYVKRRNNRGYEYALYGEYAKEGVVTDGEAVLKVIKQKPDASASAWVTVDGNPMILGNRRLAYALGVSVKTVDRCMEKGWLEGCYEPAASGWHAFDLMKCKRAMTMHDIFMPGKRAEALRTDRAKKALERNTFNKRMEALELPYRKLAHKTRIQHGCTWVPDDFTVDDVYKIEGGVLGELQKEDNVINENIEDNGTED